MCPVEYPLKSDGRTCQSSKFSVCVCVCVFVLVCACVRVLERRAGRIVRYVHVIFGIYTNVHVPINALFAVLLESAVETLFHVHVNVLFHVRLGTCICWVP